MLHSKCSRLSPAGNRVLEELLVKYDVLSRLTNSSHRWKLLIGWVTEKSFAV